MKKDLQQLFDEFIFEAEFTRHVRPKTLTGYKHTFELFCKLQPNTTLSDLSSIAIGQFFKALHERKRIVGRGTVKIGVTKSTVATYGSKLKSFFTWLESHRYIEESPFKKIVLPTPKYDDKKFLKREEIEKILTAIHLNCKSIFLLKRNLVIFYILLFCGLRRSELLLLQVRDIDFERKCMTVRSDTSKSEVTRLIPLHSTVILHLKDYLNERRSYTTPYLIVGSKRDDRLTFDGLEHLVEKIRKHSGVRFHPHQFRHTFAANFLMSSNNYIKLQQLLGHKNILATVIYARGLPTDKMRGDIEKLSIDSFI